MAGRPQRFESGAATREAASSATTRPTSPRAWSCSTPCTRFRPSRPTISPSAGTARPGKCGSCSAEVNGNPRLMCMTRLNQLDLSKPVTIEPMRAFPLIRDLVTDVSWNFQVKKRIRKFTPRPPDSTGRHMADGAGRRRARAGIPQVHRVLPLPGRLPRAPRPPHVRRVRRTRGIWSTPPRSR